MSRYSSVTVLAALWIVAVPIAALEPLPAPAPEEGRIRVAFVLAPLATMIDFTGPWEVFQDVHVTGRGTAHAQAMPFELFTVAESLDAVTVTGGMRILPDHTFADAPQPNVIVVPALRGSEALQEWLRSASREADMVMSVCTGAFQVARAGLLDGLRATTHHRYLDSFERQFSRVDLERGVRWVDNGSVATAAGLTSGIDLALHVVARYFGEEVAAQTAAYMEHDSEDWRSGQRLAATRDSRPRPEQISVGSRDASGDSDSGASSSDSTEGSPRLALHGLDPVALAAGEEVEGLEEIHFVHEGFEYRFALAEHRQIFAEDPERWGIQLDGECAAMRVPGGKPYLYAVHDGRIYIFGTEECREEFVAEPSRFVAGSSASDSWPGWTLLPRPRRKELFEPGAPGRSPASTEREASGEMRSIVSILGLCAHSLVAVSLAASPSPGVQPGGGAIARRAAVHHSTGGASVGLSVREVSFANGDTRLAGAVLHETTPAATKRPGLVIIHGAGSSDRTQTWAAAFAQGLARRGFVVLLPDKRGSGASGGEWRKASFETLADDAIAAVEVLRSWDGVDPDRVGVIGLSQGGRIAPLAALRSESIAFVISISASMVPITEQVVDEVEKLARRRGFTSEQVEGVNALHRKAIHYGLTGEGWQAYRDALEEALESDLAGYGVIEPFPRTRDHWVWEWARTVGPADPLPHWRDLRTPAVIVYGGLDPGIHVAESVEMLLALPRREGTERTLLVVGDCGHALWARGRHSIRGDLLDFLATWVEER